MAGVGRELQRSSCPAALLRQVCPDQAIRECIQAGLEAMKGEAMVSCSLLRIAGLVCELAGEHEP